MSDFYSDEARLRQLRIKNLKRQDALFGAIKAQEEQEKMASSSAIMLNDRSGDVARLISLQNNVYADEDVARDQVLAYLKKLTGDEEVAISMTSRFDANELVFIVKNQMLINKELKKINRPSPDDFVLLINRMKEKDTNFLKEKTVNRVKPRGEDAPPLEEIPPEEEDLADDGFGIPSAEKRRGEAVRVNFDGFNRYLPDDYRNENVTVRRPNAPAEPVAKFVEYGEEYEITPVFNPSRNPIAVNAEPQLVDVEAFKNEYGRYMVLDLVNNTAVWKSLGVKQVRAIHNEIAQYDGQYYDDQLVDMEDTEDGGLREKKKSKADIKQLWLSIESRKKPSAVTGKGLDTHLHVPAQQKIHHSNQIGNANKQPVRLIYGRGLQDDETVVERTSYKKPTVPTYKAHHRYFDKIYIDMNRLKNNQLFIKYIYNNVSLKQLPTMTISDDLKEIVMDTINNRYNKKIFNTLNDNDKRLFRLIVKAFKLKTVDIPEDAEQKEFREKYRVLVGSYLSGSDSPEIKKELLKYVRLGLAMKTIPTQEAYSLIYELAS